MDITVDKNEYSDCSGFKVYSPQYTCVDVKDMGALPMMDIRQFAAKSDQHNPDLWLPFTVHSSDTAGIMEQLFIHWLSDSLRNHIAESLHFGIDPETNEEMAIEYCRLLGYLHDIGKLTPAFQSKIASHISGYSEKMMAEGLDFVITSNSGYSSHPVAGEAILLNHGFPQEFCEIVGTHHGKHLVKKDRVRTQIAEYPENYYGYHRKNQIQWDQLWEDWINFSLNETHLTVKELSKLDVPCQMLLTGLLIMADWLASNQEYFPYISVDSTKVDQKNRINIAWSRIALPDLWYPETAEPLQDWFFSRFGFMPNLVQQRMMEIVSSNQKSGIYILEAPMGIGKTEAALASSEILAEQFGLGGIFFGLPSQATANGVFGRVFQWASQSDEEVHAIRLAHGMVDLNEEYQSIFHGTAADSEDGSLIVHEWFEGRKQALLSDFVVATIDQFLLASLKQKHVMLRHLGLAGKVVIIDEVHAYDAYMNVYLDNTLTWMGAYGVPVIILSATLPFGRREELIKAYLGIGTKKELLYQAKLDMYSYPLLTWTDGKDVLQDNLAPKSDSKRIKVTRLSETELVKNLREMLDDGGCAAVIVNTVKRAQELTYTIMSCMPEYEVICFHSRFIATDRSSIERSLLSRVGKRSDMKDRNRLIVVGTQVMEQSLDLDFDYMITELCPMDLLLQRAGRLHRHYRERPNRLKTPILSVLESDISSQKIYDEWILSRTECSIPDVMVVPECIPKLVSKVYDFTEEQSELYRKYEDSISEKKNRATGYCINTKLLQNKYKTLLSDFMDDDVGSSKECEASVRDTGETIEVLVLKKTEDHKWALIDGGVTFDPTLPLEESEAIQIARERLRLPFYFGEYYFEKTVRDLSSIPGAWQDSSWLKGEMLMILDQNLNVELIGKCYHYDQNIGFTELEKG